MDRTIILSNEAAANAAMAAIRLNWQSAAQDGHPLAVRFYPHKSSRTQEQNALMWVRLGEISEQAWISGRQFSPEVWAEHFKREFLPDESGPSKSCRKGYMKWDILPSGERSLAGSTTQLTTYGMSEYMENFMSYAAQELGVMFSASPAETGAYR